MLILKFYLHRLVEAIPLKSVDWWNLLFHNQQVGWNILYDKLIGKSTFTQAVPLYCNKCPVAKLPPIGVSFKSF